MINLKIEYINGNSEIIGCIVYILEDNMLKINTTSSKIVNVPLYSVKKFYEVE